MQIEDVSDQWQKKRDEVTFVDGQDQGVEKKGEDIGRLKPGEAAFEKGLDGDGLAMEEVLAKKRLREDEAADGKKKKHATTASIEEPENVFLGERGEGLTAPVYGFGQDVYEDGGGDGDEAQAVNLRNPVSVRCDTAKFHYIPGRFSGADSGGRKRTSVSRFAALLSEDTKSSRCALVKV